MTECGHFVFGISPQNKCGYVIISENSCKCNGTAIVVALQEEGIDNVQL
jgi:hypothetical protein